MAGNPADAIGWDDQGSDWLLRPEVHAGKLPVEAGALKRILERAELKAIVERFGAADAEAVLAQKRYKRIGRLSLYAATLATLVGAASLFPIDLKGIPAGVASGVQILSLAVAFLASRTLAVGSPFDRWMKKRAEAEIARIALFDAVASADEPVRENELPLLPLKLEYFRRYQLDVQSRYYSGRGGQHQAAVWRNNRWLRISLLVTIASIMVGAIAFPQVVASLHISIPEGLVSLSQTLVGNQSNRIVLGLGTIASALYGLGTARSLMDLDERNASRFLTTFQNLAFLAETALPGAREAARANDSDGVAAFIKRVHEQISSEHREWILLSAREREPERLAYSRSA